MKNDIRKVAELAGVSVASVSRALNGKPGISAKTRDRIIAVCEHVGYKPSDAARKLKVGKKSHIGLFIGKSDTSNSRYISTLFKLLNDKLIERGEVLSIFQHDSINSLLADSGAAILTGVVDNDSRPKLLKENNFPFVSIGKLDNNFWVTPDDRSGGTLAAEHLYERGCKKIVIVESALREKGTKERANGFQAYMQSKGILSTNLVIEESGSQELETYRMLRKLLQDNQLNVDAFFCETDAIAYGTYFACIDSGMNVPHDIKIVGFDGMPDISKHLTTIKQDINAIAEYAIELLDEARSNKEPRNVTVPVELKISDSSEI